MNRRLTETWTRGAALTLLALVSLVAESSASAPCLTPDPKTCKIPEDCMYKRQLAMKRAFRDAFASSKMRCKAYDAARKELGASASEAAVQARAGDILYNDIASHPERVARKLKKCASSSLADPPGWTTGDDCVFQANDANGHAMADPDSVKTCKEFLDASRTHERNHAKNCRAARDGKTTELGEVSSWVPHGAECASASYNQGVPKTPNRKNMNDFADEEADSYTLEIWQLEDERAAAIHRCTTARDAAKAAEAASKAAKALSKQKGGTR